MSRHGEDEALLDARGSLRRELGTVDLSLIGIGASIGAGIFVLTGVASQTAGPAVSLSFIIAGSICVLDALCYAELAGRFPYSGGAYLFVKHTFGQRPALVVGINLLFDYHIGAAAIARSFTAYLFNLLQGVQAPNKAIRWVESIPVSGLLSLNVVAPALLVALSWVLVQGVKEGATLNRVLTTTKVVVVGLVVIAGSVRVEPSNWSPFMPSGIGSVLGMASTMFFAFVGFDAVANSAEECRNPSRDVPVAMVLSLGTCAALYILVVLVITGMNSHSELKSLDESAPLADSFVHAAGLGWVRFLVDFGGVVGLATTLLIGLYAQARLYLGIARDGLLSAPLAEINAATKAPANAQVLCALIAMTLAAFLDVSALAQLLSIGVMTSYAAVSSCVLILRSNNSGIATRTVAFAAVSSLVLGLAVRVQTHWAIVTALALVVLATIVPFLKSMEFSTPDTYATPLLPYLPWLALCCNVAMMGQLPWPAWLRLVVVTGLTLAYFEHRRWATQSAAGDLELVGSEVYAHRTRPNSQLTK